MLDRNHIDEKLLRYLLHESVEEESKEVAEWLTENEENMLYFEEFQKTHLMLQWGIQGEAVRGDIRQLHRKMRRRVIVRIWYSVAAVSVLLLSVGLWLWFSSRSVFEDTTSRVAVIQPGKMQATLYLSSGESINMTDTPLKLKEQDGTTIEVSGDGRVAYSLEKEREKDEILQNRIVTPRGGEFLLTLEDGTKVWLNAATEFVYPVYFDGDKREVYLKGEAYFAVAKDARKPFLVHMENGVAVNVYGTEFNVSTLNPDRVETVLVRGNVGIGWIGQEVMLRPNQKAVCVIAEKNIVVEDVDVLPYVAWKDGNFVFQNESLGDIMNKLSLWYDLQVTYENDQLRDIRLSGNLQRHEQVQELLRFFERISEARFRIVGKQVIVSN